MPEAGGFFLKTGVRYREYVTCHCLYDHCMLEGGGWVDVRVIRLCLDLGNM